MRSTELLLRPCPAHATPPSVDVRDLLLMVQQCPDCWVTHPTTGRWVTCLSTAEPH